MRQRFSATAGQKVVPVTSVLSRGWSESCGQRRWVGCLSSPVEMGVAGSVGIEGVTEPDFSPLLELDAWVVAVDERRAIRVVQLGGNSFPVFSLVSHDLTIEQSFGVPALNLSHVVLDPGSVPPKIRARGASPSKTYGPLL